MKRQFGFFALAALLVCAALVFGLSACSSGGDDGSALLAVTSGGSGTNPAPAPTPTPTPTPTPVTAATYTVTFNANDGSQNPATATQSFTEGTPQALNAIANLGFSKDGFYFAGWGVTSDASKSSYADGFVFSATQDVTLYALWSEVPVYSVNIVANPNGDVIATPATGVAGAEITLTNSPNSKYEFTSYTVIDAHSNVITVTDGKFIMPESNVTVKTVFSIITYAITISDGITNGTVSANVERAAEGEEVTLTISPSGNYVLNTLFFRPQGESAEYLCGMGDTRTFVMPAKNVTVRAEFMQQKIMSFTGTAYKITNSPIVDGKRYYYINFGDWPQTIKAESVVVGEATITNVGSSTYYKGSDGAWYAKIKETAYENNYKYSDDSAALASSKNSCKYFKVEPIAWRMLSSEDQTYQLLSENVLIAKRFDDNSSNYKNSEIREWLNGEFFNTAFTTSLRNCITDRWLVLNSAFTTYPSDLTNEQKASLFNNGQNSFVCDDTKDFVHLVSESDVTKTSYGFTSFDVYGPGNSRIRKATDYAKASGVKCSQDNNYGSVWLLRSPSSSAAVRVVTEVGNPLPSGRVDTDSSGVVPCLWVDGNKL